MIDVGMSEQHRREGSRLEGKGTVVQLSLGLGALEHAAIDEQAGLLRFQQVAGAGDGARRAVELEADRHVLILPGV